MIIFDDVCEFQYTLPNFSPISLGHDLAPAEAFITPQQEAHHSPPITDYVTIDISRDLEVLTEEDAFQLRCPYLSYARTASPPVLSGAELLERSGPNSPGHHRR